MKVSILIAVEHYADKGIRPVTYAEADARGLASVLDQHGFDQQDRVLLVNNEATKTIIESRVRKAIQSLSQDDILHFYYAGHGFSKNGRNLITCHDTQRSDLEATSIPLDWLFKQFRESGCKHIVMFLDSCESGMLATAEMRGIYSDLTDEELADFFDSAEHCVCFAACKTGEESWPSGHLKHGVWTYHLIESLNGDAPLALERGGLVTSNSLQNYLKVAVPKSLRAAFADKKVQTPWVYGGHAGEFLVADVTEILEKRKAAANPHTGQVTRVSLVREQLGSVRRLSGFRKTHRVPDDVNDATTSFVARIASDDIQQDLDDMHGKLTRAFKFKRVDLQVDGPIDGAGTIITPFFNYTVDVRLNSDDPSEVVWRRQVTDIKEPDQVFSEAFEDVLGKTFDTVAFTPPSRLDLQALIDRVEQIGDNRISIDYDPEATSCILSIEGVDGEIRVTRGTFEIVKRMPEPPKLLLQSFFDIQRALIDTHDIRLIPFDEKKK
jgi:hypothetical protein